ncbi:MAG: hypothetical protein HC935_04440 [Pseudanabaena sp. SU_2_4]|nr:hypothetical protein [Pseudanabaena sp. SU_2_4]
MMASHFCPLSSTLMTAIAPLPTLAIALRQSQRTQSAISVRITLAVSRVKSRSEVRA